MNKLIPSGVNEAYLLTDLKKLDRWVCWQDRGGEDEEGTKIPVNRDPEGESWYPVSYRNSDNWYEYTEAKQLAEQYPAADTADGVDGLQVVIKHRGDDFIIVDLDNCVDNGHIDDWAATYIEQAGTYTEFSPSGTGVHLVFRGTIERQGWAGPADELTGEVYKKYLITVTENHVTGTPYRAKRNPEFLERLFSENDIWWRDQLFESQDQKDVYGAPTVEN